MPKLYCGRIECKYNGKNGKCKADIVNLNGWYGRTVNEGYQEFSRCATFEESEESKRIREYFTNLKDNPFDLKGNLSKGENNE